MEKEITPMKRISAILANFKEVIEPCFQAITLNKASERTYYKGYQSYKKKAVINDFLLIFEERYSKVYYQNKKNSSTIAFVFNYMGLKPEEQTVMASLKTKEGNIVVSPEMSLNEFKLNVKELTKKLLLIEDLKKEDVYQEFTKLFITDYQNILDSQDYKKIYEEKMNYYQLPTDLKKLEELKDLLNKNKIDKENAYVNSMEFKMMKELELKLHQAKIALQQKNAKLMKEFNIEDLTISVQKLEKKVEQNQESFNKSIANETQRFLKKQF